MATTPQGALLLPQGRYIHLFQPLHTPKGHCVWVGWGWGGGHKALRITSGAPNCMEKQILPRFFCSMRATKVIPVMYVL